MALSRRIKRQTFLVKNISIFLVGLLLFVNMIIIHRQFSGLERENIIDPGGTGNEPLLSKSKSILNHWDYKSKQWLPEFDKYSVFESRLRKLMEKSAEDGLDVSQIEGTAPLEVSYSENLIECEHFVKIRNITYLASGWTKAVYSGIFHDKQLAIKTVDSKGQHVTACVQKGYSKEYCYHDAAQKIVKEIIVLQALANDNVIKVLGFCVPGIHNNKQGAAMVTELGESVDLIKILQMSWENRFRISLDLAKIIHFMANNPYGSMAMNDFRRQQFVIVDGVLKLSDVDDVGFGDPSCLSDDNCTLAFSSSNFTERLSCVKGRCLKYNEKRNIFNSGRHFTTFLLPHGAPKSLVSLVDEVVEGYSKLNLNSKQLLATMHKIEYLYKTGEYLNRTKKKDSALHYKKLPNKDLPGEYDYRCRLSLSGSGCTLSVFDVREAEDICNMDPECKSFVMTQHKTWSGRTLAHFKTGSYYPTGNPNTTLYVKPSRL